MVDAADYIFGAKSKDDKLADFDVSTAELVLRILGRPELRLKGVDQTQQAFSACGASVNAVSTRLPSYNLEALLTGRSIHPVVREYLNTSKSRFDGQELLMVVRAHGMGRLIVTEAGRADGEKTPVVSTVADGRVVYVHHFKEHLIARFKDIIDG